MAGAVVTWLIRFGDWIRDLTAAGSRRAIAEPLEFQAKTAWVIRDGGVVSIPATDLVVGDEVVVYPGEMIPVDGEIVQGTALIDQKTLPIIGALGGATVNLLFVSHFQKVAHGDFTVRRLERLYGAEIVWRRYEALGARRLEKGA